MTDGLRHLNRRTVTLLLGGATLSAIGSSVSGAAEIHSEQSSSIEYTVRCLFEEQCRANSLGSACLNEVSFDGTSWHRLKKLLLSSGRHDREGDNLISIRRQIAEFILQDFSDNAVILVNGWVLSITEALLFA